MKKNPRKVTDKKLETSAKNIRMLRMLTFREKKWSSGTSAILLMSVMAMVNLHLKLVLGQSQGQQQVCPEQNEIAPCVCTVKKNGLDVLCETTDLVHITKSLSTLKGKSPIIFYLKLRHNNLPKLQGFVFLSLDIRHLTIHNSSLAAIEENALSSLGKKKCETYDVHQFF